MSEVDAAIRTLNKVTAHDLFTTNSLVTPIFSRAGNLSYAKMIQDITNYEIRMEQKVTLKAMNKAMKNALEVYQEFTNQDNYESKKRYLADQIQLLFLFMRLKIYAKFEKSIIIPILWEHICVPWETKIET